MFFYIKAYDAIQVSQNLPVYKYLSDYVTKPTVKRRTKWVCEPAIIELVAPIIKKQLNICITIIYCKRDCLTIQFFNK